MVYDPLSKLEEVSDVVSRAGFGGDSRKRNRMIRSGVSGDPSFTSDFSSQIKESQQPQEYLGAGRTSDIPAVSKDGNALAFIDKDKYTDVTKDLWGAKPEDYTPTYSNNFGNYYDQSGLENLNKIYSNSNAMKTFLPKLKVDPIYGEASTQPQSPFGNRDRLLGSPQPESTVEKPLLFKGIEAPKTLEEFYSMYGGAPAGGWNDQTVQQLNNSAQDHRLNAGLMSGRKPDYSLYNPNPLQNWLKDPSALLNMDLYGKGTPEEIQRGFNILQRSAPSNIGEFWSMSPEVQKGILQNPGISLQQMRAMRNPANGDWLSIGAEGGLNDISDWQWGKNGLSARPGSFKEIDDSGMFGKFGDNVLRPVAQVGAIVPGPWTPYAQGYLALDSIDRGDPLGAFMSTMGATGGFDQLAAGMQGTSLGNGIQAVSDATKIPVSALTSGGMGALMAAARGGNPLTGGLTSGLASMFGGYVGGPEGLNAGDKWGRVAGKAASFGLDSLFNKDKMTPGEKAIRTLSVMPGTSLGYTRKEDQSEQNRNLNNLYRAKYMKDSNA